MHGDYSIYVGSVALSLWASLDSGKTWTRYRKPFGGEFPYEAQVRAVAIDPKNSNVVYAGDQFGLLKSTDHGTTWNRLSGAVDGFCVWSLAVDPTDSNIVFAGTRAPFIFRSKDAGKTWQKLPCEIPQTCSIGTPRVTSIKVDPADQRTVWAVAEIGGVYRSLDGGDSWIRVHGGLSDRDEHADIHNLNLVPGSELKQSNGHVALVPGKRTTALVTIMDFLYASDDYGESMRLVVSKEKFRYPYLRGTGVRPDDPRTLFLGLGDTSIGGAGTMVRSKDGGATWQELALPVPPNSGVFHVAMHPSDPDLVLAATLLGQLYRSEDGGNTWEKLQREFPEVRALTWAPN